MSTKQVPTMSKMSALDQDIQYMLGKGYSAPDISQQLEIPTSWVFEVMQNHQEDCGPFATSAVDH